MTTALFDDIDFEYATSMAERARQLMVEHKVPPTPHNFELWFTFAHGTAPELTRAINILIDNKRAFDAVTNRNLYMTYIEAQISLRYHGEVSDQLHNVLTNAKGFLTTAMTDNRAHVEVLDGVASQIQGDPDPCAIIQGLVGELSKAMTRATTLEAHFSASSQELDKIRENLSDAERRSKTDALTGLANRLALDEFLRTSQIAAMENGEPLGILLMDVDHFKTFNDNFGHQTGDQVLRLISNVLREGVREQDLAARYGGEELAAILPNADLATCTEIAERIRQRISGRQIIRRTTGEVLSNVTVSIGVAQFNPGETVSNLFERCDRALYAAKRAGRNRTVSDQGLDSDIAAA